MKTIEEIKKEIESLVDNYKYLSMGQTDKAANKRAAFLRSCLYYLETNPKPEFLREQLEALETKLKKINENFNSWYFSEDKNKKLKNPKAAYNNLMNTPQIKEQINTLIYLLD